VTTVVGSTDAGKSAIIRALRWLFLNQPRGKNYNRHGTTNCSVAVSIDDHIVKRSKGKKNYYQLDDEVFKAFGGSVPGAIEQVLNITELNFQKQHDASFWLSLSPTEVGRQLNAIVDMELMDKVLKRVQNDERKVKTQIEYEEERRLEYRKHLADLRPAKPASEAFEALLQIRKELDAASTQETRLLDLSTSLNNLQSTISKNGAAFDGLQKIIHKAIALEQANEYANSLEESLDELEELEVLHGMDAVGDLNTVLQLKPRYDDVRVLELLLHSLEEENQELEKCQKSLKSVNSTISTICETIKVCDKCGRPLTDE